MGLCPLGICVGLALLLHVQLGSSYILSCYFTNWAQHRPGRGSMTPKDIDPCLCDHLIYAFAGMKNHMITTTEKDDEQFYAEFQALKNQNKNLKTIMAIGGWGMGTTPFTNMVASPGNRQIFIGSVIKFLRQYEFDGLDIDWEYPIGEYKELFTVLCQELMAAFEAEGKQTNRPRLMLTAAVAGGKENIDPAYQIPQLGAILDYFHVMTYDYQSGDTLTENSPLYKISTDHGWDREYYNVDYAMNYYKSQGAPAEKLLVGFPSYGHTFLPSTSDMNVCAPQIGPGPPGPYTQYTGFWAYYEICDFIKKGATQAWDAPQDVPYAYNSHVWVGYDNPKSFGIKAEWLKKSGFGGGFIWSLDMDDFSGTFCNAGKFPLISTLKTGLHGAGSGCSARPQPLPPVTPTQHPAPQPQPEPQPSGGGGGGSSSGGGGSSSGGSGWCAGKSNGLYPDPTNKNHYYNCAQGRTYEESCAAGLVFDTSCSCCNWA